MKSRDKIKKWLHSFAKKVVKGAKVSALGKGFSFAKEVTYSVKDNGDKYDVFFYAPKHAEFVDKGVSGTSKVSYYKDYKGKKRKSPYKYGDKMPPPSAFVDFIKKKGIKGRDKKGRFIKRQSLAFAMSKAMQKNGQKGLSWFSNPLSVEWRKLSKQYKDVILADIHDSIEETNNQINKHNQVSNKK